MQIRILIFLLIFLPEINAQIPGVDTLFKPSDLHYLSELEEQSFAAFFRGNPDHLCMIVAVNPSNEKKEFNMYRTWIDGFIQEIRGKNFDRLSPAKKISHIRDHVKKTLLVNYNHGADFGDLFQYGSYNYLTAATIYAVILGKLDIPYLIHEHQTHIDILAYPEDHRITFAATEPGYQYFMFEHDTRVDFVEFLKNSGVVDDSTYKNSGTRFLFEEYYFANYGLGIRELIGMAYLNVAVFYMERQEVHKAYHQLEKAFLLYPFYKSQYLLLMQLSGSLKSMDYHDEKDLQYLVEASKLVGYGIEEGLIREYFSDIIHTVLVEEGDTASIDSILDFMDRYIDNEDLMADIRFKYLYEYGRNYLNDARYEAALAYFEDAYRIQPVNEDNQNVLVKALAGYSTIVSPTTTLHKIEEYESCFKEIESEDLYTFVKADTYLKLAGEYFQLQDEEAGEKYMHMFEQLYALHPEIDVDHLLLGRTYSSAAIYYYRKGRTTKTREVLERGLRNSPENYELITKLKHLN